jgi:predicted transcriptional regulator
MSTATLTSLAMLKVNIDQGTDYLDYLRPFVLQVLIDHRPYPVTALTVKEHILTDCGLDIPERAVQIVLQRLARKHLLTREKGVYHIATELPDPGITAKKADADRHIQAVIADFIQFSQKSVKQLSDSDEAVRALCSFLEEFDISCLKAYLRGTAIPSVIHKENTDIVLVSQYVLHLQRTDPERFRSFQVLVQGHMLANALLCPDLANVPKTFKDVVFYLDTPLLVRWLSLEGQLRQKAIEELVQLVRRLGGTVAVFTHTQDELRSVIQGAARHLDDPNSRGAIVLEAQRQGTTRSDLLLLAEQLEDRLQALQVYVRPTPPYVTKFQIDEGAFADVLDDEVSYYNPRAKEYDIKSLRSVYVLRQGKRPTSLEKAVAVLVTSNAGFARAAFRYGQRYEESREVSPVITDFSLANVAWLKAPMGAPSLPIAEVLAFSYAALGLPKQMLDKLVAEAEKLEKQGRITARDHQLLRSSWLVQEELMRLTLGEEDALTEQTITETLRRVTDEIKKEESEKYQAEQAAHRQTLEKLEAERAARKKLQERLYWQCSRRARLLSWFIAGVVGVLLISGILFGGLGLTPKNPFWVRMILVVTSVVLSIIGLANLFFGFTVRQVQKKLEERILTWLLKRESTATGMNLWDME